MEPPEKTSLSDKILKYEDVGGHSFLLPSDVKEFIQDFKKEFPDEVFMRRDCSACEAHLKQFQNLIKALNKSAGPKLI